MTADLAFAIGGIIALCVGIWSARREKPNARLKARTEFIKFRTRLHKITALRDE